MKFYKSIFLLLITQIIFGQKLIIRDSNTKESIIGAEIIECVAMQNIGVSNIKGETHITTSQMFNKEIRIQAHGYLSKLIELNSDSVQIIELKTKNTIMTLGSEGLNILNESYINEVENSCPNELEEINGLWKSTLKTKNGFITLFEISFFSDTLITIQNNNGLSKTFSQFTYEIKNDTINLSEIEQYTIDTNIGFVKSHFKKRNESSVIPLCLFRNNCKTENELTLYPKLEFISLDEILRWDDITQSELFKKSTQIETNY